MTYNLQLPDGVYHATSGKTTHYLVKVVGGRSRQCINYFGTSSAWFNSSSGFYKEWGTYEPASYEDTMWMEECIKAGALAPKPEILHYQIY